MPNINSLGHRPLPSSASSVSSTDTQARFPRRVVDLYQGPLQYNSRVCFHAGTDELPCTRRITKTIVHDAGVTHQWVSCRGTRYVSTTMPLSHGVPPEQIAADARVLGHSREERFMASCASSPSVSP